VNVTPVALAAAVEPIDPGNTAPGAALVQPTMETHRGPDYLLIIIFVLAVAGGGLIVLGSVLKRAA
jgi:hypothetical protein